MNIENMVGKVFTSVTQYGSEMVFANETERFRFFHYQDCCESVYIDDIVGDLSDLEDVFYDILVFFSPSGIKSLFQNFPEFEQKNTRIAAFGQTTVKAVAEAGLKVNIEAPSVKAPSMSMALEQYIKNTNKK